MSLPPAVSFCHLCHSASSFHFLLILSLSCKQRHIPLVMSYEVIKDIERGQQRTSVFANSCSNFVFHSGIVEVRDEMIGRREPLDLCLRFRSLKLCMVLD